MPESETVMQSYRLPRSNLRDISFVGRKLGEGEICTGQRREIAEPIPPEIGQPPFAAEVEYERGATVTIYLTQGQKYVAHVNRWTDWGDHETDEVSVVDTGEELLAALMTSKGSKLGSASRDAWNEACENWEPLADLATERID